MSYAVKQDMIDRFGNDELVVLTDRASTGNVDDTVLGRALADADAEINSYLEARYALPLSSTPAILTITACDMARYFLYEEKAPENVAQRYKDAIRRLEGIVKGSVSLGLDGALKTTGSAGGVQVTAPDRIFTQDTLSDYAGA